MDGRGEIGDAAVAGGGRADFYKVLGLKKQCSTAELRNAYKKLAMVSRFGKKPAVIFRWGCPCSPVVFLLLSPRIFNLRRF